MIKVIQQLLKWFMVLLCLAAGGYWLVKQGVLPADLLDNFTQSEAELVTYYQWTDGSGNVRITREPPSGNVTYSSFQGSPGLDSQVQPVASKKPADAPSAKVISTYRDDLEATLIKKEMLTQCRWVITQLFNTEKQINNAETEEREQLCKDYRQRLLQLPSLNCKASMDDVKADICG